jgi:hypothetical protein
VFAFWSFKSRQEKSCPNRPLHNQLPPTGCALAGQ